MYHRHSCYDRSNSCSPPHTGKLTVPADVIILEVADGQPPTKIIHHITINSLIQFITSAAKFAFMVPIVSALGQLKWLWFKDEARPLTDFQLHDGAGSGGLESVKFSLTLRMLLKSWVMAPHSLEEWRRLHFKKADCLACRHRCTQWFLYISIDATSHWLCFGSSSFKQWNCFCFESFNLF